MAVKATKIDTNLIVKYKDGVDKNGKEVIKKQNFSKVKTTALDQDVFDVAKQVEILLGKTLDDVVRQDQSSVVNV